MPDDSLFPTAPDQNNGTSSLVHPLVAPLVIDQRPPTPSTAPFTRPVFADPVRQDPASSFLRARNVYDLDPDPTGERTVAWGKRTGQNLDRSYVAGLNVLGRFMGRDQLLESDAGRQLLHLAALNREGYRRDFTEALFHGDYKDFVPFLSTVGQVGGSISDAVTVFDTFKKLQDQEPVTDDELIKTSLLMAQQDREAHGTWGATVATIVRQAPAFMLEFLLSGTAAAAVRGAAARAGVGGTHLALTRGAKILAKETVEDLSTRAVASAAASTGARATAEGFAKLAGTDAEKRIVKDAATQLFGYMKSADALSMYRGFSDDALQAMAKNRAQYEFQKMLARKGGSTLSNGFHSFAQWMGQSFSRGLIDFGSYGTEEASVLFTRSSTAGRALAEAVGVFTIEAPLKGSVLMLPKKGVEAGVIAPLLGQDGRVVSDNQLALRRTALQTDNRSLMDNAEAVGLGLDLLEYVSENTGRGLGSMLTAAGLGLERLGMKGLVRPLTTAISPAGFVLPTEGAAAVTVGGKMRQFVQRVFGSRTDYARRVAGQEAGLVVNRLRLTGADAEVMRRAVLSGNVATLRPELRQAIGPDFRRFVQETVRQAYDKGVTDLQYKTYARYAAAKWMQKHNVGPETVMNLYNQMGYDGVLGEMFEERYTDVVKGLLGLDEKKDSLHIIGESEEEASFFNNLVEAVKGLYPGFSQLTAEAVGFMFPMVTRGLTTRAMSAIGGGGELMELRSRLDVIDDAMRHNTVGEMTYSDAQAAFDYARRLDENDIRDLNVKLADARRAGNAVEAESLEREIAARTEAAKLRAERQKVFFDSVDEAAKNTADALIAVPVDTYGTLTSEAASRAPVLTEAEARQVLDAQKSLGDFASQLARQVVEGQLPLEGESEHMFRKVARKLVGIAGFLATGDFSLAAANPAQWTARDMGLSKHVIDTLRDGFRAELTRTRDDMYAREADRARAEGRAPAVVSAKDVLDETQRRFDLRARQIMTANLAVHQLRSFSDGKLREQAAAQWATQNVDKDGRKWNYTVDAEGRGLFFKLSDDGASVDESSFKSLADMWAEHRDEIEKTRRDILKATIDIMSRRLTGADAGRNAVLAAVTLDHSSDMLDIALYDAAMHMIGAQDLVYSVSLDGRTPLKAVMDSRSVGRVSDGVVDFIASKDRPEDVKDIVYESVAQSLRLRFDGTAEGLKARNDKIFRMAKLMRLARREGLVFFSKEILEEDSDAARMSANGTSTLVARRQADGTYTVDYGVRKDDPKQRDVRSFSSLDDVRRAMEADGYIQDEAHTVLTQTKIITSSDMFWMIRELGLAREYYERLGPDRKAEQMHPMLRRGADGKFLNQADAERILAGELAQAARGAAVDASSTDRAMYERLFGDNGYMKVGEKLLADHGVHKDSRLPYTGEFHDYAPSRYTLLMSAGRISPKSADTYVTIGSPVRTGLASELVDTDLTSGLVNALLLHAYSQHGALLRDALGGVVSDFVSVVRAATQEALADADKAKDTGLSEQLRTLLRLCCDDVDRVVRLDDGKVVVKKGTGLTPVGFTILANAFGLFRAREDATNPMLRAVATIAPRVWASPAFLGFESLLNVVLGGNYLDTAIWNAKPGAKDYFDPALTGVPQIMALASADANALRTAVQSSLPAGMGYEQFLDAVLTQLTAQSKTGAPAVSAEEARELRAKAAAAAAANADSRAHFSFMGGLVSTMKAAIDNNVVVSKSVTDFLASVMEAVANDPRATDAQKQAVAKQLEFMQRRAQVDASQEAYARKVEELSDVQERLRAAEEKVEELRRKVTDMARADLERESYNPPDLVGDAESPDAYAARRMQEMGVDAATATDAQRQQIADELAALAAADQRAIDAWYQGLPAETEVTDAEGRVRLRKGRNGQWYVVSEDGTAVRMTAEQKDARPRPSAARVTLPASVGAGPSEAERAAARTNLADAIAERDDAAADLLKKQEAATGTPAPEGLQALHFGGDTMDEEDLGINADEVNDFEDDGDATVASDPLGMDVPEVFAREAARREDGFTTEWGRPLEGNGQRLTRRQAKLAAGLVVRSLTDTASEDAFLARLGELFPHMTEDERQDVLSGFRALDAARLASGRGWAEAVRPGQHFGFEEDEKSDESRSSDNFNERALAEYNSDALKDFTALLRRVAPEANGSIMGFVEMMRGRVRGRAADAPAQDVLTGLLNPQMLPGVENLSQADAQHKKTLKRFGDSDIAAVAESLLAEDPQAAFLVAYLSSLPVNARTRFAGLCAGSVAATPVHVLDGVTRAKSARVDGKISDMLITASFDRLVGASSQHLTELAETLRSEAKTLGVSAFSRTGGLEALKKNAAVVAELLATVTGRNSPLYRAMTSRLAHVAWARMDADQATSLLESVSRTGRGVDVVNTIARALELLAARGGRPTRLDIETTFVAAFTVGQPTKEVNENGKVSLRDDPGLRRAPAHIDKSDPLLTFLNELQAAMPRTMMRAEIDQQREQAAGSVVVAPRGMVPLLSRWLYQKGEGSFTEICRATWPDVSDETLAECRQDGTWPDEARTPVCAKCISSSLTPIEVYRACQAAYGEKGANWVPIYSGDHSSFTLLQVPAGVDLREVGEGLKWKIDKTGLTGSRLDFARKDEAKFNYLGGVTKMIAFGRPGSATDRYGSKDFASVAVDGSGTTKYTAADVVGVSLNGGDLEKPGSVRLSDPRYQREIKNAIAAGATFVADNPFHRGREHNREQEGAFAKQLEAAGYVEEARESGSIWRPARGSADAREHLVEPGANSEPIANQAEGAKGAVSGAKRTSVEQLAGSVAQAMAKALENEASEDPVVDRVSRWVESTVDWYDAKSTRTFEHALEGEGVYSADDNHYWVNVFNDDDDDATFFQSVGRMYRDLLREAEDPGSFAEEYEFSVDRVHTDFVELLTAITRLYVKMAAEDIRRRPALPGFQAEVIDGYAAGSQELARAIRVQVGLEASGYEDAPNARDIENQANAAATERMSLARSPAPVLVEKPLYKSFAKAAYKAIGMHLMFTDTKRSAISSLEAQGTGLVGVDAQGNYGEHRVHIIHSWIYEDPRFTFKRDGRKADKNAAFLGSTFMAGYGAQAVADMSADPESNTKKVHVVGGAGRDLFFIKSLTVSQNGLRGKFREGSAPRAVFDYLEKFRGKKDTLSTDTLTDDDSYKIGPGNSKGLRVVNGGGNTTVMAWVFDRLVKSLVERGELQEGYTNDQLADAFKKYNRLTGDELDELVGPLTVKDNARGGTSDMKLSEIMPGVMVNVFDGWSGPALDLSYREDSAMAYTVANVAHKSNVPAEPGRAPRNYEIDALAMVRTLAAGGWLKTPGLAAQFHELLANWGLLASSVYSDPKFREAMIQLDENLTELRRNGEFVSSTGRFSGQHAVEEMARQIMAKTRQAANLPLRGIDAPLVAAGASLDVDGKLVVHTTSLMEAAMLKGSELFTDEEQAFYGANRRLALCNVNVSNNGFRYGWFLAPDAETKYPDAYKGGDALQRRGTNAARRHANAIAWAANEVRKATDRADADPSEENKKAALDARKAFASMFVDHHGVGIDKYGDRYLSTYSVEDLFIPSQSDSDTGFDYSAVQCEGQDLVFNDATGGYHVFLGGTMFGLPRTPSYNGSMWLQTVRAGLPVTEEETDDERGWRAGEDAMVSPDPYTNAILGCDHDGDKTKLYMLGVNQNGAVRTATVPAPDGVIIAGGQLDAARRSAFVNKTGAAGLLELVRVDDEGSETVVAKDDTSLDAYWRISENARKRVSNSFVRFLFSLSRQLPTGEAVDAGNDVQYRPRSTAGANDAAPRTKFLGGVASSPTKASPVADNGSLLKAGLPEILKPDGSAGTLGDPELAMEIATSAMDAGDARGVMVSLARSLHVAWALGAYDGVTGTYAPDAAKGLFGPMDGLHWLRCMYHIDGISNATFDDIKEQVCGRLGWTKGMMDAVLTELFLRPGHAPTTDAEFERILKDYASEIRAHGPRYWMLRNSRVDDEEAYRTVALSFVKSFTFRGQVEKKRFSRTSVMDALGLTEKRTERGPVLVAKGSPQTLGDVIGRAVVANGRSALLSQMTRDSGRNPAMGLVYAAVVKGARASGLDGLLSGDGTLGSTFNVEAKLSSKAAETLDKALAESFKGLEVFRWVERRGLILGMRSFGQSINYLTADPGAPNAATKAGAVADNFDPSLLADASGASRLPSTVAARMNEANQLMYRIGRDLTTVDARAVNASRNRSTHIATLTQTPSTQAREFAGRMLAKDMVAPWNLMRLRSNQQQMPLLAEFFTGALDDVLGAVPVAKGKTRLTGAQVYRQLGYLGENVVGKTHPSTHEDVFTLTTQLLPLIVDEGKKDQMLRTIRTWFTPKVLGARLAVESLTSICYRLMVTSGEFAADPDNRAAMFLRMTPDNMGLEGLDSGARGRLRRGEAQPVDLSLKFGELALGLRRIMPEFRANDRQALDKVRGMFDRVILGQAFTGPRMLAGEAAKFTKATSFSISRRSLADYARELAATSAAVNTLEDIKRLNIPEEDKADIEIAWNALGADTATITPATLFGALLPAYTLMTARMSGVPDERSTSLLSCLPERYYATLSAAEARRRATDDVVVPLLVGSDLAPQTFRRTPEGVVRAADSYALEEGEEPSDEVRNRLRGGSGLREYRTDNTSVNTIDIFDPAFEAALGVLRDSVPAVPTALPKATTASHLRKGGYDANTAKLALAMGSLLGSWATVEYNGGTTFTIRGDLRGDAGTGKAVSIVVDASSNPLLDSEEDVNRLADSSAYAASLTEAVDLGMTADDFLLLPKEVRRALVKKYGVGGATSSKVEWTVGAKGVMMLAGKISIPAGGTKVYHEYFHQMMRMFESFSLFGKEDYAQLEATFGKDPSGRHRFNEEKAAESFRKWVEGNTDKDADSVRTVFQRILDFLKGLLEVLKRGFSYEGDEGEETLFRMMVHGIAQPSTSRMAEAQMEATTAASALLNKLQPRLARGEMTQDEVDEYVDSKEAAVLRNQYRLPKAPKQARTSLEAQAAQARPVVGETTMSELEELENAWQVDAETIQASDEQTAALLAALANSGASTAELRGPLYSLVQTRRAMALTLGVEVDLPATGDTSDMTAEDDSTVADPVDETADNIRKVTSPLVNNNLFYRTANSIRSALEAGLRETGAWTDDLAYVVRRYVANDAASPVDENLRRRSILHGLRRAMAQVNPEAAQSLENEEIENSLAYRAALVMHQHLESSFLGHRSAGRSPATREGARHASQYNVSAWVLSTDPTAPSAMVADAQARMRELYNASPSGASKAELQLHLDQMDVLEGLVGDPTKLSQFRRDQGMAAINEVIGTLRAGTKSAGVDDFGNLNDIVPIDPVDADGNPTTVNPKSQAHLDSFMHSYQDPAVQESLKLALTTAYQVAAMAKYYGELDVHPATAGDIAEAKRLARLNGIPEHMSSAEFLGEHLVGDSNLVDNPAYVDYQCQSHFIAQNVDAWLRSMVRDSFGAHEGLGRMMSDEHFEYQGIVNAITQKENWIAHMLGVSLEPGGELLKVIRQRGEYRMKNGEVVRRIGDEYIKFDNYGRKATSIKMTEEDIRRVDMWLKMCSAHANGQTSVVTGVDGLSFYRQLSRNAEDYAVDRIVAKRKNKESLNPVEWAVWRMTRQVPEDLLTSVHDRFVQAMLSALAAADEMEESGRPLGPGEIPAVYDAATYNSFVVGELVKWGVLTGYNPGGAFHEGGVPRYENAALLVSCDLIDENFRNSDTYTRLRAAGREKAWLDRDFIVREFMDVWNDTVRFVKRHPWLTHGDGQYFHAFGTALPFWRGSGVFMYNAVRTDRQYLVTPSDKLSAAEQVMARVMASPNAGLRLSACDPAAIIEDVDMLAGFIGADHRAGQFLQDVLNGQYGLGERKSVETGVVIPADATYGDIAHAFYEKARRLVWDARSGYTEATGRHVDLENIIARYEDTRLERGEVFGGSTGFKDTDMFRMHGTLPANYEIGHKVHKCIDGITNAMMSRATLANLLLTPEGATGAPVYYADPDDLAAEASGLPDAFWGNLAEWWQRCNPAIGDVYDPAKSGVANAKAVYAAVRQGLQIKGKPRKAQVGELSYTALPGDDSQLVSVREWLVLDGSGEDFMNATAGGEAMGYLKHFLDAGKVLGLGGAGVRAAIQRALSYSKSLSVSFSFFFPMATRWESPMGAVGAMSTIGSNWKAVGDWMKEHPDAANKIRGMFGGKAWITHDYIGMKDILRMMDSNDPFLAEMYSWAAALGITVSTSVTNPMEPDKTVLLKDIRRMKDALRRSMGAEAAGKFSRMMDALLVRQGDKAFNYVLNATKLAVVAQLCMKLRHQAKATGKAFDPVRDLKKYSRYINAEIGGIDPMQFAWAHPVARQLMNMALFSWQWTLGAWQAGGGSVITDLLTGGHTMTNKERAYFAGRWMRMYLGVMIGVPALFQALTMIAAKLLGGGDDDDDHWGTWQNEDKARWSAFDLTPLLRAIAHADETHGGYLRRFKENGRVGSMIAGAAVGGAAGLSRGGNWFTALLGAAEGAGAGALAPSLVPLYTGNDAANKTTHRRRYYMHFGKQGWEFFRWFDDARGQGFSKQSMILQRLEEGIIGRSLGYLERSLPWDEMGQFERWLSPTTDSALFNIAEAFLPFSVGGMNRNGDAGILPIFGPVQMGASQTATQKRLVAALEKWAANDRAGYRYSTPKRGKKGKPYAAVADILADAKRNGLDPDDMLDKACGQVMRGYYGKLFDLLPETPDGDFDRKEAGRIFRALHRLGAKKANALAALKARYKEAGAPWKELPQEQRRAVRGVLSEGFRRPFDY